jgi:hypothetical protein
MTVYARSDIAAVSISTDHGGCGTVHSRPAPGGIPVKIWGLTCHGGCEDTLRADSHWAGTPHTVPETPDETAIRLDVEKRGQVEQQTSMATALNDLAKLGALPSVLAQLMSHLGPNTGAVEAEQPLQVCRNGHMNRHTLKFCGECGADMSDAINKQPVAALSAPEVPGSVGDGETGTQTEKSAEVPTSLSEQDLQGKSLAELRTIARSIGAEIANSKKEQVINIVKINVP